MHLGTGPSRTAKKSSSSCLLTPHERNRAADSEKFKAGILIGWAVQGYLVVGHCRDTWWLGTAGVLCGWALQGYLVVGH